MAGIDKQLDEIYDKIDALCWASKWEEIDSILAGIDVDTMDINLLLGYLTTSSWAKSHLKNRVEFFNKVKERTRGEPESLLQGLE